MTYRERPPEFLPRSGPEPRPIGAALDGVARRLGAPAAKAMGAAFTRWEEAVGATIAGHAHPAGLTDGVLTVVVDDPAWATQLRFLAGDLVTKVNAVAGDGVVSRIEIRVGSPPR